VARIGVARLTAGLDRLSRLDLVAHRSLFGRLPRLSDTELISMARQVGLRGRGGAAFPAARKLEAVVESARRTRRPPIVVVNATEGEPGSFKDQMLLIRSPYLVLSGAALVAEALGAREIVVGVAGNELANSSLDAALEAAPALRKQVSVVQVPERFISGESGALIRAINGKAPVPPGRKTLATTSGVDGLPTLLSNAETFAQLAVLALLGPEQYAAVGMPEEPGSVLLSVSGSAARPAVVEVPTGVPLGTVLDLCQAPAGDGVLVGGYHGMWLPAESAYTVPVSRAGLEAAGGTLGAGVVLPLGDGTCPLGEVSRIASYLAGESAGQCGPCKLGLPSIAQALAALIDGSGGIEALDAARRSAVAVSGRGACAHPDGTTRFVLSALQVFEEDLAAHVFHSSCGRPVRGVLPLPSGPWQDGRHRLVVDWTRCDGHGLCAHLAPELIRLDGRGYPVLLDIPVPPWLEKDARQAVDMCPALALRLVDAAKHVTRTTGPMPRPAPVFRRTGAGEAPMGPGGYTWAWGRLCRPGSPPRATRLRRRRRRW
jgi:NADH:ubiquinone oxidoreductase subunit F (NADH-binding)/ferredoxin